MVPPDEFLVIRIVFVATVVVTVIRCNTSLGAALKLPILAVPSDIVTLPALSSLAILTVTAVLAGTVFCKVIVKILFALLIVAELVAFAASPKFDMAPVALVGFTPPVADNPLPVIVDAAVVIFVALRVVLTVTAGTDTEAVPPAFNVTV